MEGNANWLIDVENQVNQIANAPMEVNEKIRWDRRSIYKLPVSVTSLNKNAYKPQVVSFGPYHCDDKDLKKMEEHKDRALLHFLKRSGKPLQSYFTSLEKVANDLKDAYDTLDPELQTDTNKFLKIMIRDGCFMLEILSFSTGETMVDYASNDPIFSEHGRLQVVPHIKRDMLKLENQLPMLLLQKLLEIRNGIPLEVEEVDDECFDIHMQEVDDECFDIYMQEVNKIIYKFFFPSRIDYKHLGNCTHMLDLYRKILIEQFKATSDVQQEEMQYTGGDEVMRPAVELIEAGITIKSSCTTNLRDIKFDIPTGTLTLPLIVVDDTIEPLFLNLIAFERFHPAVGNEVSAYVYFMDNIVNDAKDISLLQSMDVIKNAYGSDKAAANLFNSLTKDLALGRYGRLAVVHKNVNDYCKKLWPRYIAYVRHTYFRNPWALVSVIAAIILFALTIVQTIYSVI